MLLNRLLISHDRVCVAYGFQLCLQQLWMMQNFLHIMLDLRFPTESVGVGGDYAKPPAHVGWCFKQTSSPLFCSVFFTKLCLRSSPSARLGCHILLPCSACSTHAMFPVADALALLPLGVAHTSSDIGFACILLGLV